MRLMIWLVLAGVLIRCSDDEIAPERIDVEGCSVPASIRNFAGIDGCGYVLELADGTILEPLRLVMCSPPPESVMTLHDPLFDFQEDEMKVLIDYEDYEGATACMTGKLVIITCISKVASPGIQH
jgi:hypothetical protein